MKHLRKSCEFIQQSDIDFISLNSAFLVQNDGMYLPGKIRETCISEEHLLATRI